MNVSDTVSVLYGKDNILLEISANGTHQQITFDMLRGIWNDISEGTTDDIEYLHAVVCEKYVICCSFVAQGQGGIVFVWDTDIQQIVHYSDGRFALTATIHNNKVYILRDVHYWGVKSHLELDFCNFGTMSIDNDVTQIELDEETANSFSDSFIEYKITFDENNYPVINKKQVDEINSR